MRSAGDIDVRVNRWTILTVVVLVGLVLGFFTTIWRHSWADLITLPLGLVVSYWIVGGCARRGEPVARSILHRLRIMPPAS